jgi:hypothetical protein
MVQQETDLQVMSCTEKIYLDQRMKIKDLYKWEKLMRHKKVNVKQVIQTVLTLLQQIIYLDQRIVINNLYKWETEVEDSTKKLIQKGKWKPSDPNCTDNIAADIPS